MEPVKGGGLADPPERVKKLFKEADPNASCASWALRYAASFDNVFTVLSGMSNVEQMEDNLSYMKDFRPLNEEEQAIIREAQRVLGESKTIPCTACRYCVEGCPKQIPIPEIFAAVNLHLGNGQMEEARQNYRAAVSEGHGASDCIQCRRCEQACPQHLPVTDHLQQAAEMFIEN
jgi:predicted aldo/keto reductase-like oxidoreductase